MNVSIIVITYNHEKYIQQCLESIKYQIMNYNRDRKHRVQVLVADDCSTDKTQERVCTWMDQNSGLIDDFVYIKTDVNAGTCRNYMGALKRAEGDYIKVIGGDDFFPDRSVFKIMKYLDHYDIVYGLPMIYFEDAENTPLRIKQESIAMHHIYAEESKLSYYDRIHRYCFFNAPGTYVKKDLLLNGKVLEMLSGYKYVDDYPQWIKFSEIRDIRLKYIPRFTVVYRRTRGSAYIVRNAEVRKEIIRIFRYALRTSKEWKGKLILYSGIYMQKSRHACRYFDILSYIHKYYEIKHRKAEDLDIDCEIAKNLEYIKNIKEAVGGK